MSIAAVTGGRDFYPSSPIYEAYLRSILTVRNVTILVHGDCRGADRWAAAIAESAGVRTCPMAADWERFGRRAGPLRNEFMSKVPGMSLLIAFPGGRGTAHCVSMFERAGVEVVGYLPCSR